MSTEHSTGWSLVTSRQTSPRPRHHGRPRHADQGQDPLLLQGEAVPQHAVRSRGGHEEIQVGPGYRIGTCLTLLHNQRRSCLQVLLRHGAGAGGAAAGGHQGAGHRAELHRGGMKDIAEIAILKHVEFL